MFIINPNFVPVCKCGYCQCECRGLTVTKSSDMSCPPAQPRTILRHTPQQPLTLTTPHLASMQRRRGRILAVQSARLITGLYPLR